MYENGVNGSTVEFFKVKNGGHSWPGSPMPNSSEVTCMDFDPCKEIWRFFSQYTHPTLGIYEETGAFQFEVYPKPVTYEIYIKLENDKPIHSVKLVNIKGEVVLQKEGDALHNLTVRNLPSGTYFITIYSGAESTTKKILIY